MDKKSNWDEYWRFAEKYPRIDGIRTSIVHYVYRRLLRKVKFNHPPRILEFGAGTGSATLQLLKQYGGIGYLVDKSLNAIEVSKNIYDNSGMKSKVCHILADALQIEFRVGFDLVHSGGLIEHFTGADRLQIIEAHTKSLKPDGYLALVFPVKNVFYWLQRGFLWIIGKWKATDDYLWNHREVRNALTLKGFSIVKTIRFTCELGILAKRRGEKGERWGR